MDFVGADIAGNFEARQANFFHGGYFSRMKVRGDEVHFENAIFTGTSVNFYNAELAHRFWITSSKFLGKEMLVVFDAMKVGGDAVFDPAVFEGHVDFGGADIEGSFFLKAKFQNPVGLRKLKVGHKASVTGSFDGFVIFNGAEIAGDFEAKHTTFLDRKIGAESAP